MSDRTAVPCWLAVVGAAFACWSAPVGAQATSAAWAEGTYQVTFGGQALTLVMQSQAARVTGRLLGPTVAFDLEGEAEIDDEGDPSVEGVMTGGGAAGLFSFFPDDDGAFGLVVTPLGPGGVPRSEQAAYYPASRVSTTAGGPVAPNPEPRPPAPAPGAHPLVGTWATQVVMSTPGGSVATQMFMEFRADGTMLELGSRSMAGFDGGSATTGLDGGGEQARWRTEGDVLVVSYQGSAWVPFARYRIDGTRLALTFVQDGSVQLWYRQGG